MPANCLREPLGSCILCLVAFEIWLQSFRLRTLEAAGVRGLLVVAAIAAFLLLRRYRRRTLHQGPAPARRRFATVLAWLVGLAVAWNLVVGVIAIAHTVRTGDIRMDQGQATYRAALGLWRGENPYASGALLDYYAYLSRAPLRAAAGVGPQLPEDQVDAAFGRYWDSMDPALRAKLLPVPPPDASASARREVGILGYKYGPVPVLATAVLAPLIGPTAVPLLNTAGTLGLFALLALLLRRSSIKPELAAVAFLACLIDHFPTWYYIHFSDSDIWPLFFCVLSVLAFARGWDTVLGLSLALALGSKTFPSLLYLPLLVMARSTRAALAFALVGAAIFAPWLAWDASGFIRNMLLWPALMQPDITSWVRYLPTDAALAIRVAILVLIAALVLRLATRREPYLFWSLTVISMATVGAGTVVHNNYVPWFSLWGALAVAEVWSQGMDGVQRRPWSGTLPATGQT